MMWDAVMALRLQLLHGIIEEEIQQHSIKPRLRVLAPNLPLQQLDAPDAASAQLNLPWVAAVNALFPPDVRLQRRAVLQAAERVEDLGDPVVCKHGDLVDVVEGAKVLALEAGPEVGDEDLGALVDADGGVGVFVAIVEGGEGVDEEVYEGGGRLVGFFDAGGESAVEFVS